MDGAKGFVGSDRREAEKAIREAVHQPKVPIRVTTEQLDRKTRISIHIDGAPKGQLYLALAHDAMKSQVLRGENAGQGLAHVAVVYSIEKLGQVERGTNFDLDRVVSLKDPVVSLKEGTANAPASRIVVFVAQPGSGRVVALGQIKL